MIATCVVSCAHVFPPESVAAGDGYDEDEQLIIKTIVSAQSMDSLFAHEPRPKLLLLAHRATHAADSGGGARELG